MPTTVSVWRQPLPRCSILHWNTVTLEALFTVDENRCLPVLSDWVKEYLRAVTC